MENNVKSLKDMCIERVADNFEKMWTYTDDIHKKSVWCHPGIELPGDVPEKLLNRLSEQLKLNDGTLSLFQPKHACLQGIEIPNTGGITKKGLKILSSHRLLSLDICLDSLTLLDVVNCLGPQTLTSLKVLKCKGVQCESRNQPVPCPFFQNSADSSYRLFPKLHSVRCLSLINLGLTDKRLEVIAKNVPSLNSLDISDNSAITNISPLQKHAKRLQVLIMQRLNRLNKVATVNTLRKLKELRYLDVSVDINWELNGAFNTKSLLMDPSTNPNLTSLDMSGRDNVTYEMLRKYLDAHPSLNFLGLLWTEACRFAMFDVRWPQYRPGIEVAGTDNLDQIALSLKRSYLKSEYACCTRILDTLNNMDLSSMKTDSDHIIRALLQVMPAEGSLDDDRIHRRKRCLDGLEAVLRHRCVSHVQPDTIKQLRCACPHLLEHISTVPPQPRSSAEICLEQADNVLSFGMEQPDDDDDIDDDSDYDDDGDVMITQNTIHKNGHVSLSQYGADRR